nr:MAK10-like protein [Tanacetum cinerariifolium]
MSISPALVWFLRHEIGLVRWHEVTSQPYCTLYSLNVISKAVIDVVMLGYCAGHDQKFLGNKLVTSQGELLNLALGWHLEEMHVTWAHLEKKRTRLRLYTKSFEETVHTEREDGVVITKESLSEAWTRFKDLLKKVPRHGIDIWIQVQIFYDHVNPVTRRTIDQLAGGKLRDKNAKESRALLDDLALYVNESWNDPRDFAKPVKAISLPQDVPSTSDRHLIELESQYCLENPEQAFIEYASSHNNEVGSKQFTTNLGLRNFNKATNAWKDKPNFNCARAQTFISQQTESLSTNTSSYQMRLEKALRDFDSRQEKRLYSLGTQLRQLQDDMIRKIKNLWKAVSENLNDTPTSDTAKNSMAHMNLASTDHIEEEEIQSKESKAEGKGSVKPNEAECNDHKRTVEAKKEVEEERS